MKNYFLIFLCFTCFSLGTLLGVMLNKNYIEYIDHPGISILLRLDSEIVPENGFVPDKETALKIAKAVWLPIYGKKYLMWRIYQVELVNDVWYIEGASKIHLFFGVNGGGPRIKIDKFKGSVLDVSCTG